MSTILHNPKSNAPAVYIPCWLIQISASLLSSRAKLLYGRLSQWSTAKGCVHRTINQLSDELGMNKKSIERALKELKDNLLIGTFQKSSGGINHYRFYDHPWMHLEINENLEYHSSPYSNVGVPPLKSEGTPPSKVRVPPLKSEGAKIKINKKEIKSSLSYSLSNDETHSILSTAAQKREDEEILIKKEEKIDFDFLVPSGFNKNKLNEIASLGLMTYKEIASSIKNFGLELKRNPVKYENPTAYLMTLMRKGHPIHFSEKRSDVYATAVSKRLEMENDKNKANAKIRSENDRIRRDRIENGYFEIFEREYKRMTQDEKNKLSPLSDSSNAMYTQKIDLQLICFKQIDEDRDIKIAS